MFSDPNNMCAYVPVDCYLLDESSECFFSNVMRFKVKKISDFP